MSPAPWLTVHQVALALGIDDKTVRRWLEDGTLKWEQPRGPGTQIQVDPDLRAARARLSAARARSVPKAQRQREARAARAMRLGLSHLEQAQSLMAGSFAEDLSAALVIVRRVQEAAAGAA